MSATVVSEIQRALAIFLAPGQVCELRALGVQGKRAVCEVFGDHAALARRAAELDALGAAGVYFTPNPLRPDLTGSKASCRAADVVERHWLLVDVDPARPAGVSSTEDELRTAWAVLDRCRGTLDAAGLQHPAVGCSGNGWHLCYHLLLPNDPDAQELVKATLKGLQARCGDQVTKEEEAALKAGQALPVSKARVGVECHDAPRIWKLYGTTARKGPDTAETVTEGGEVLPARPHRRAVLIEGCSWDRSLGGMNAKALRGLVDSWRWADDRRRGRTETSGQAYAAAALRQELAAIAAAPVGDRNNQVNRSAFALGQLVAGGALSRPEVEAALLAAGAAAGLAEGEVRSTVRSGLEGGTKEPRDLSGLNGHAGPRKTAALRVPAVAGEPLPSTPAVRVEAFPLEVLPPELQRFITEGAYSLCCPPDYLAVPMLCAAGAAIGASRALRLTRDWWVFPAIYAAVVAPPSAAKSPAANRSLSAVLYQQVKNKITYKAALKEWNDTDPKVGDRPTFKRTYTTDTTTEKLASLLADCPRGLLYHRDELVAWIASFNQYRDGGKGADQQTYMSIWDHQSISIERKGHDDGLPITVQRPCLSVFGTVQPAVLHHLTHSEDGFIERILFSFAEPTNEKVWDWNGISDEARSAWRTIVGRLYSLEMGEPLEEGDEPWPRFLAFAEAARPAWENWYAAHQRARADLPEAMHPCHAKLESYCARLAVLIEMLWYASDAPRFDVQGTPEVGAPAVECASRLITYFLCHARRAYGCLELTPQDRRIAKLVAWIDRRGGCCTIRDILGGKQAKGASEATRLIETLVDRCLGVVTTEHNATNGKDVIKFRLHQSSASSADPALNE